MCENGPAVTALAFLQQDVASVVDHNNRSEEEQFRSLLTYLLSPSSQKYQASPLLTSMLQFTSASSANPKHDNMREGSNRPLKRSRSDRDLEEMAGSSSSGEENGMWTSDLPLLSIDEAESSLHLVDRARSDEDITHPSKSYRGTQQTEKEKPWCGVRYRQRTAVFEMLLKFIDDGDKQPGPDLLDLLVENQKSDMRT